jgi:thioredoxin domain-containing protein 10
VRLVSGNRVFELSDKFLELYKKDPKSWLIKFYAPWCHHCKQLEPVYMQVAQRLHNEEVGVHVARVDCTRFVSMATHFSVKGFPTLLFVRGSKQVEYHGDRSKEEIVDFAKRLNGPSIRPINHCYDLDILLDSHRVYFLFVGPEIHPNYTSVADDFHSTNWFYHIPTHCENFTNNGIHVVKASLNGKIVTKYENGSDVLLNEWVKFQRFPQFVKVTTGNFNMLLNSRKLLVLALVEEHHSVGKLASGKHEEFRDLLEAVSHTYDDGNRFIFGWCSHLDMINSVAMKTIEPLPQLIAINSSSLQYHLLEDKLLPQNVIKVLDDLRTESLPLRGGDTFYHRIQRLWFDSFSALGNMYRGNPVLTLLLFGLPLAFFSIIVYTSCCSELLDAREDDEEEEELLNGHPKRD